MNKSNKIVSKLLDPWTTLTNNGIEDVIKVIKSLGNKRVFLRGTTETKY